MVSAFFKLPSQFHQFVWLYLGREFLGTKEIEAETEDDAREKYRELWEAGLVDVCDYEMDEFSITEYEEEGEADE